MLSTTEFGKSYEGADCSIVDAYDRGRCQLLLARPAGDAATPSDGAQSGLLSDADLSSNSEIQNEDSSSTEHAAIWRPSWLRPVVFSGFIALFSFFAIGLATMFSLSQRNDGLVQTRSDLSYLWRFGPTAVLTVVSIFWSRVETQALRYMPWIAYGHKESLRTNSHDYDLDYTAMLSPTILIQSLRRKHYLVCLVVALSVILKIQIVLAPGLYSLEVIRVSEKVDIEILDLFNTTKKGIESEDTSPYYLAHATRNFEMGHPFGVTQHVAYQTFKTVNGSRGTVNAPLGAVVDSYFTETQCVKLERHDYSEIPTFRWNFREFNIGLRLWFESCEQPISINKLPMLGGDGLDPEHYWKSQGIYAEWASHSALAESIPCAQLPQQKNQSYTQSLYFAVRYGKSSSNSSKPVLLNLAAVLCSSRAWISKAQVVDNGVNPFVTPLTNETKTPVIASLWDLIQSSLPLSPTSIRSWNSSRYNLIGGPISTAIVFYGTLQVVPEDAMEPEIYKSEILYLWAMNMSRVLGPWIGHYHLRENTEQPIRTTGSKLISIGKLMINKWICLSMIALFCLIIVTLVILLLSYRDMTSIWYRDPATILGNILFFGDNARCVKEATISTIQFKGGTSNWIHSSSTPIVLKKWMRGTFTVIGLAIIAGLCYSLRVSQHSEGLVTIDNESGYFYLLWTSVPTIIMLSVALYINCCDSACRGLATLSTLSVEPCSAKDLDMSLSDMLGLRVLYHSLRAQTGVVTLSQLLAIICGFLTTLGSAIFTIKGFPKTDDILLQQKTWFGSSEIQNSSVSEYRRRALGALLLRQGERTLTYPRNTYDDLVFPVLDTTNNLGLSQNTSIKVNIPAAKLNPTCWKLPPGVYNYSTRESLRMGFLTVQLDITENVTCSNASQAQLTQSISMYGNKTNVDSWQFSALLRAPENEMNARGPCGLPFTNYDEFYHSPNRFQTYAWGEYSLKIDDFQHLSTWRCNYSWAEVPTEVHLTLSGGEYIIDPEKPPRPDLSRTRPWSPLFDVPHVDNQFRDPLNTPGGAIPDVKVDGVVIGSWHKWFGPLMRPFGRFNLDALGDSNKDEEILQDLHHQYGFLAAQLANLENRFNITENSETDPPPSLPPLEVVAIDNGRRRLVQDPTVTYVIVTILSLTVIANMWVLVFDATGLAVGKLRIFQMKVDGLAPEGFNSMAAMVALLRNSNIPDRLPKHINLTASKKLYSQLSNLSFRMGWFWDEATQTKHYTIGVMGDEGFRFMGGKEHTDKERLSLLNSK